MEQSPIDLVVVDLNLDGEDGLDIVKRIAEQEAIPLIIITGERIDDVDKAIRLEFGADDYLEKKPFGLQEFIAGIGVRLRPSAMPEERVPEQTFRFAGWSLNMRQFSLLDPDGNPVELSPNEFRVLAAMVRSPQTVLSRDSCCNREVTIQAHWIAEASTWSSTACAENLSRVCRGVP